MTQGLPLVFPEDSIQTHTDAVKSASWLLCHGAGYMTLGHGDAEGYGTWVRMLCGAKMWGVYWPEGYEDADKWAKLSKLIKSTYEYTDYDNFSGYQQEWEKGKFELAVIEAKPGSIV